MHQAHWGADTNGETNLNNYIKDEDDGWIHATWTYDAENDIGQIYLDGKLDWEGAKRAPNGSGNLIIGGRSGGGDGNSSSAGACAWGTTGYTDISPLTQVWGGRRGCVRLYALSE